jgi:hypothetical protein
MLISHCFQDPSVKRYAVVVAASVVYLPKARTVKPQKPRNMHATIEVRVFTARCWVTHTIVERVALPRLLLRNAEVNTSHWQLVAT